MYDELILIGVILSLIFYECTRISPGGIVVPGYLALCLSSPERIAYTWVVVFAAYLCLKFLGQMVILYGRRRFAAAILISYLLNFLIVKAGFFPYDPGLIGCLVPGILVRDLERQGVLKTLAGLITVTGMLALVMLWRGLL